jgi:hypothetical protein
MRITNTELSLAASSQRVRFQQQSTGVEMRHERPSDDRGVLSPPATPVKPSVDAETEVKVAAGRRQLWSLDPLLAGYIEMLERMFGVKVTILDPSDMTANGASEIAVAEAEALNPNVRPTLAIAVDVSRTRREAEHVAFQASGRMTTEDGRTIDLELQSKVSREYFEQTARHLAVGSAATKDPLVLNLAGLPATLTEAKVEFDLAADGQLDRLHILGDGSEYLAWDRNGDRMVNDGTELLGPTTGDGFAEPARHDLEWRPDPVGPGTTTALSAAQVGAIYLGNVATPFTLTPGSSDEARGEARATGVFLREDGSAGTVQQLDLMA